MPTIESQSYDKLLLDAMRVVSYEPGDPKSLTNEGLQKAMTLNENLKTLGWTLKPSDIIEMAVSPSADTFYEKVNSLMSSVNAKPMYPDFPTQVMNMDEAQYRLHQLIHYFSTYGMEQLTGMTVSRGWLPADNGHVSDTEKTEEDTTLLDAKAIGLVKEDEKYSAPFAQILAKRERMTDMEREIVKRAVGSGTIDFSHKWAIPFKENLKDVFLSIAESGSAGAITRKQASEALFNVCQHPGDVIRHIHSYLTQHSYHLRTMEKKMFVDTLEKYSYESFVTNLAVSGKQKPFIQEVFNRIDFAKYGHDRAWINAVKDIKNLMSWEAKARRKIENHENDAIKFAAQRPGMLLRMTSMALRNGYTENEIATELGKHSREVSVQTLLSIINQARKAEVTPAKGYEKTMAALTKKIDKAQMADVPSRISDIVDKQVARNMGKKASLEKKEQARAEGVKRTKPALDRICTEVLKDRMRQMDTGLEGKKVYLDTTYYDLSKMPADPANKSMTQGYLPSATTWKIPDNVDRLRFFVYWNDKNSVDVDLHVKGITNTGEQVHVGWNGEFDAEGAVTSGDITYSDAAEYIDIDLKNTDLASVDMYADVFSIRSSGDGYVESRFKNIETCFAGVMAVDKIGQEVKLYDPKNCFFSHDLHDDCKAIEYGWIDVENKCLQYTGIPKNSRSLFEQIQEINAREPAAYSIQEYLGSLLEAQGVVIVNSPEEADHVLTMTKPANEKEISLIDSNFFYDAPCKEPVPELVKDVAQEQRKEAERTEKEQAEAPAAESPISLDEGRPMDIGALIAEAINATQFADRNMDHSSREGITDIGTIY